MPLNKVVELRKWDEFFRAAIVALLSGERRLSSYENLVAESAKVADLALKTLTAKTHEIAGRSEVKQ
jgi:hypothetical protein